MTTMEDLGRIGSINAAADLSAKQFTAVKVGTTGIAAAGVGDVVLGILLNKPTAGMPAEVAYRGVAKMLVGTGPIVAGDRVKVDANGKAVVANASDAVAGNVIGIAVPFDSRATGDYVRVLLQPNLVSALGGTETLTADGAVSVVKRFSFLDSSGGVRAWTLADGLFDGQIKDLLMLVAGNNGVVTPVSGHFKNPAAAVSTATFNAAADYLQLVWDATGTAWRTVANASVTVA